MFIIDVDDSPEGVITATFNRAEQNTIRAALDCLVSVTGSERAANLLIEWPPVSEQESNDG